MPWCGRRQPPLGYGSAAVTSCDARGRVRRPLYRPCGRSHARTSTEDPPFHSLHPNKHGEGDPPKWTTETWRLYTTHTNAQRKHTHTRVRARAHTRTPTHTLGRWQVHTAAVGTKGPDSPEPLRCDPKRPRPSDQGRKVGGYFRGTHI